MEPIMSESVNPQSHVPLRSLSARPIRSTIGRVLMFILGLLLGISPLLLSYLFLIVVSIMWPVSPNAPYHGAYASMALAMMFRYLRDILVLLFVLLTPFLAHRKRTRILSYGIVVA